MCMEKSILWIMVLVVIVVSCTTVKEQKVEFQIETDLYADSIPVQSIYDRAFMKVYGDYLVITSVQSDMTIHVYKTPELELVSEFGPKGHAANEISSFPTLGASLSDTIYIRGFDRHLLTKILMVDDEPEIQGIIKLKFWNVPNDICVISDSTLCFKDIEEQCIKLYDYNKEKVVIQKSTGAGRHNQEDNVNISFGSLSSDGASIVYAYQYEKRIDVFDAVDLTHEKSIIFPDANQNSDLRVSNIDNILLHYTGGLATSNGYYMLYRGFAPNDEESCCSIEFFDNNLNAQCRYKLDRKIYAFAIDEKNGYMYGCNSNQDYIYRYKFR